MNAPRNSPSELPPLVSICRATEIAPALSPQLFGMLSVAPEPHQDGRRRRDVHRNLGRVASESGNVLLYPAKGQPF